MRTWIGAAGIGLALAVAACSPAKEKTAETPAAEAPAAPAAETPAAPPAAEAPAAPAAGLVSLDITDASGAKMSGDPAKGQKIFAQCATCHSIKPGENRVGPSLHAIVGRKAGTVPGFRYSEANKNSGITWTEQEMFVYLENPRAKVPGTIMAFVGLRDAQQRADVIAYLQENTK